MAHFAKIEDGIVTDVIVIDNSIVDPENTGTDNEQLGKDYIASLRIEGTWVQTSYNNNIRGTYAAIGHTYDAETDTFKSPQPYPSWVWSDETKGWEAPLEHPLANIDQFDEAAQPEEITSKPADEIWFYKWNEELYQSDNTQGWELIKHIDDPSISLGGVDLSTP